MFVNDESDLGSTESQPPSIRRRARDVFLYHIDDITKEVSPPPA